MKEIKQIDMVSIDVDTSYEATVDLYQFHDNQAELIQIERSSIPALIKILQEEITK